MFRFTIRDVLWLMVVVGLCAAANAQVERRFKPGDTVYVKSLVYQGDAVVVAANAVEYEVEIYNNPIGKHRERFTRQDVFASREQAENPRPPKDPLPDLSLLYQAIGVAMAACSMLALFAVGVGYMIAKQFARPALAVVATISTARWTAISSCYTTGERAKRLGRSIGTA